MAENIEKLILDDSGFITPLNESIKKLNETEQALKSLNQTSQKETAKTAAELKKTTDIQNKAVEDLKKGVSSQIKLYSDQKKAASEVAAAILKSSDTAAKFSALMNKLETMSLNGATMSVQDLEKEFTDLLETAKLTDDQIDFLTNNIEAVAAEIASLDVNQIQELANETEQTTEKFKTAKSELRQLTNLINSGQLTGVELEQAEARAAELTDTIGDVRNKLKLLASDTRGLDLMVESITAVGAGFQIVEGAAALYGDESKELQETLIRLNAVMAIANGLQQAGNILTTKGGIATKIATGIQTAYTVAVGNGSLAMKVFRGALAATGVGLLVIGLATLITNFDKVKEKVFELVPGLEKIGSVFKGLYSGIVETFKGIGDVITTFWEDGLSASIEKAKELGKTVSEAGRSAYEENEAQKVRDLIAKDLENLAKSQRRRAEILEAGGKDSYKVIESATANELAALKLRGEEMEKIQEKQLELELLQVERRRKIEEERKREQERINEERRKALEKFADLQKQYSDIIFESGTLTEEEKFNIVKQKNIDALINFKDELTNLAKVLKKDVSNELTKVDELIKRLEGSKFIRIDFDSQNDDFNVQNLVNDAEKRNIIRQRDIRESILSEESKQELLKEIVLQGEKERLQILNEYSDKNTLEYQQRLLRISEIDDQLTIEIPPIESSNFFDSVTDFESLLQKSLNEIFKDSDIFSGEDARQFLSGAFTLVSEFGNILNEANELKLNEIDKQLDRLSERREKLQDELDKELELQKEGLANNVGNKQSEVDGLLSEEERLTKERERIQKESQKRQLIAETVQQTASLITSSINIINGFSTIPVVGLPLGIAAVASLLGFFAKTKADAFKATKLYKGADRISDHFGFGERHGDTDLPSQGEGYSLVNRRTGLPTNVVVSGKEMILPESVSLPNEQFFAALRLGKYNGIDLNNAMDFYLNYSDRANKVNAPVINNIVLPQQKVNNKVRTTIPHVTKKGKKVAIVTTITDDMKDGHIIHLDF